MTGDPPLVVDATDGKTVVFRGKNLYSPTTPLAACRRRVAALDILDRSLVIVPSPLLGHGLPELLHKCGPGCRIVLVELEPQLAALSAQQLPHAVVTDPRVAVCYAEQLSQLETCFPLTLRSSCERVLLVNLSAGSRLHSEDYSRLVRWLQDEIRRAWQNRMTTMHMARLWFRNLFANLPLLPASRPIESLRVEKPTLVLGAGPSLQELLPQLQQARDQLFVIAVDTALPVLEAHSIAADAVVAVEAQHANLGDFLGVQRSSVLLFADLFSYPAVVRLFPRHNTLFFASRPLETALVGRLESRGLLPLQIPPLGSVGVVAVKLACSICSGAIGFSGLDFSYADGKTHANGAPMLQRALSSANRLSGDRIYAACLARARLAQPDKRGGICKTDMVLLSYAEQLQSIASANPLLYDLGAHGLATGARQVESLEGFLQEAAAAAPRVQPAMTEAQPPDYQTLRDALEDELALLQQLEASIGNQGDARQLQRLLQAADYLCCETGAPGSSDQSALRRSLVAARFYRIQINRALARVLELTPPRT